MENSKIMNIAQSNLFNMVDDATEQMKYVEGDIKLADLQGFVAGSKDVKELLKDAGFDVLRDNERVYLEIDALTPRELEALAQEATAADSRWAEYERMRECLEEEKKAFLYSDECTKGRDLAYIHAWKRAVHFIERYYSYIEQRAAAEQAKGATLDFDE